MHYAFKNVCSKDTGTEHTLSDQKCVRATAVIRGDACFGAYVYFSDVQPGNLHQSFVTMRRGPAVCIPRVFHVPTLKPASVTCDDEKDDLFIVRIPRAHSGTCISRLIVAVSSVTYCVPRAHTGTCVNYT